MKLPKLRYVAVYEESETGYSAYVPDLPGCIATGSTREEVERNLRGAIALHLEGLKAEGLPIPQSGTWAETVEVSS